LETDVASTWARAAIIALVATASAIGTAEAVVRLAGDQARALRAAAAEAPSFIETVAGAPVRGAVPKASDGHYWAYADVDGASVRVLVDTGATAVALTPRDAERLGLDLSKLRYGSSVVTAGGRARAAPIRLASVTVAGARLTNVDALVIEKGLDASLLGMSYLGRLSSFEATPKGLFLRP
jgi:aspartyl protease family protein